MVPSDDDAVAEDARAFADRSADEAFADAADVLTADGRTVGESLRRCGVEGRRSDSRRLSHHEG